MSDGDAGRPKEPWHQSVPFMIGALLVLGPLALPVVWMNKKIPSAAKLGITVLTVALTLWLVGATAQLTAQLQSELRAIQEMSRSAR